MPGIAAHQAAERQLEEAVRALDPINSYANTDEERALIALQLQQAQQNQFTGIVGASGNIGPSGLCGPSGCVAF